MECRIGLVAAALALLAAAGAEQCSDYSICTECRSDPDCGWCEDGSSLPSCLPGGYEGPNQNETCSSNNWFFTSCPPCECNGMGTECHPETGKCFCNTKGVIGDHCEKCDTDNYYFGDPNNNGTCFYDLSINYMFTFNLSKKEDRHYTRINFKNTPPNTDTDVDFGLTCSAASKVNITAKTPDSGERRLLNGKDCTTFQTRFLDSEYKFGLREDSTPTSIYIYVYDFHPPIWFQINFSQHRRVYVS